MSYIIFCNNNSTIYHNLLHLPYLSEIESVVDGVFEGSHLHLPDQLLPDPCLSVQGWQQLVQ